MDTSSSYSYGTRSHAPPPYFPPSAPDYQDQGSFSRNASHIHTGNQGYSGSQSSTFKTRACSCGTSTATRTVAFIVISVVLVALAALAAYYCFTQGFNLLDSAYTSLQEFGAYFLIYSGAVFTAVAAANAVGGIVKVLYHVNKETEFSYSPKWAVNQVAVSLLAPIALLPVVAIGACYAVIAGR